MIALAHDPPINQIPRINRRLLRTNRQPFLAAALIALAVLAVYGGTVGFAFVFDDHIQIERNPWLRAPDGLWRFFTEPFWGFYPDRGPAPSNYYRPLFGALYSLVARLFGIHPVPFHTASLLLHLAVSLLVALLAKRLASDRTAFAVPVAAGLLFAVHPVHAEAVAWVGGQADLLAALFALLGALSYLASVQNEIKNSEPKIRHALLGPLFYLLACFSKETGAALILVLAAIEATGWRRESSLGTAVRRSLVRLTPYATALALYLALRIHALGGFAPRDYRVTSSLVETLAHASAMLARYLGFLLVPFPPRVLATVPSPPLLSPLALTGLAMGGLAAAGMAVAIWNGRIRRETVLPLAFLFAFLLPALATNSIGGAHFAERYLYLPSAGLAWLAGFAWSWLFRSTPAGTARKAIMAASLVLILAAGAAAWDRATLYRNDFTLFREAVRVNPRNEIARNNLGMALYSQGRLAEAEREYREALRLRPSSIAPTSNLALLLERRGDVAGATKLFEDVRRRSPAHTISAVHLARFHLRAGDRKGAARILDAHFAAGGASYDVLTERAALWLLEGQPEKAIPLLERAVKTFPEGTKGRKMLERATAR